MWLKYFQSTGQLFCYQKLTTAWSWILLGTGYAGHGEGLNDPVAEKIKNVGPIPVGIWSLSLPFTHPTKGPICFRLIPLTYFGDRRGFLIHGDNSTPEPKDGSEGCIVLNREIRQKIADLKISYLVVEAHA